MARTVLFSREDVAGFINANFEAAWEMVRPVPIIRIDFGNDRVITRTLHGNVASHVCAMDGQVLDIVPGMYQPAVYAAALAQLRALADSVRRPAADRQTLLVNYHRDKARVLENPDRIVYPRVTAVAPQQGPRAAANPPANPADRGKGAIERRVEQIVVQPPAVGRVANARVSANAQTAILPTPRDLARWDLLAADTWLNETERRRLIHQRLVDAGPVRPEQIKNWLYREVLHADLEDPYLGLGDALVGDDIFRETEE